MWNKEKSAKEIGDISRRQEENQVRKPAHGPKIGKKILINRVNDYYLKKKKEKGGWLLKKKKKEKEKKGS